MKDRLLAANLTGVAVLALLWIAQSRPWADAWVYWTALQGPLYMIAPRIGESHYLYSPAFAAMLWPLTRLAMAPFFFVWTGLGAIAYWWLLAPLGRWRVPGFAACLPALWVGNIEWLLALSAATGLRYPMAWALPVLTKVTPGIGVLWFAVRREWRSLAIALAATVGIASASALVAPELWTRWAQLLLANAGGGAPWPTWVPDVPLSARLLLAAAIIVWGARGGRTWVIPVGMVLAQPDLRPWTLSLLAAIPRLGRDQRRILGADRVEGARVERQQVRRRRVPAVK